MTISWKLCALQEVIAQP